MDISPDFKDLLREFAGAGVRFLIVGAHAVAYHARPRATSDFDIWVDSTNDNARRVYAALGAFGAPLDELALEDLTDDDTVFQIGIAPNRIDILTGLTGVEFSEAWSKRVTSRLGDLIVPFIGKEDLLRNKRATGRPRDIADVEMILRDTDD